MVTATYLILAGINRRRFILPLPVGAEQVRGNLWSISGRSIDRHSQTSVHFSCSLGGRLHNALMRLPAAMQESFLFDSRINYARILYLTCSLIKSTFVAI